MQGMQKIFFILSGAIIACGSLGVGSEAMAARMPGSHSYMTANSSASAPASGSSSDMMVDLSVHYVRDTRPEGQTDTAARFSIGGMFNSWVGLDGQGLYEARSKNYLVGANLRFTPTDWFFIKGGVGGYADKQTRELKASPLAGTGIVARLSHEYYFLTEASYFQVQDKNNISFGMGLGFYF